MTICIHHSKGGVGKSTLSWNLAHSFLEIEKTVKVIDLDFQQTLYFINQMSDTQAFKVLQPQTVQELMQELLHPKEETDITIIDVGGFDSDLNRTALEFSHKVIIPISDSVTEVLGFKTFEGILEELVISQQDEIQILLNNIHPLTKNFDIIKKAVGDKYKLLNTVVRARKVFKTTMGEGKSVFDTNHTIAKDEIRGVRDELISHKQSNS